MLRSYYGYLSQCQMSEGDGEEEERGYEGEDADLFSKVHGEVCL